MGRLKPRENDFITMRDLTEVRSCCYYAVFLLPSGVHNNEDSSSGGEIGQCVTCAIFVTTRPLL